MGIYRYQGQQDGKLRDCGSTHTSPVQDSSPPPAPMPERFIYPSESTQDWHTPDNSVQGAQTRRRQGFHHWLKRVQWVGFAMKNLSVIVTGGVVLVSTLALVSVWRSGSNFLEDAFARFSQPQPAPTIDMQPVLVQQLRSASELTTAVFAMQTVVPASRDRTIGGYTIGRTTLLYIAYGEVRAGVDLSALKPEDVQLMGNSISIRLPPPQILDSKIDVTRSKIYDYDRGFLGLGPDAAPQLQEFAEQETLGQIVSTACNQGVLQSANERAKLTVSQLLITAGYTTSNVETQPPAPEACATPYLPSQGTELLQPDSPQSATSQPEQPETFSPTPIPPQLPSAVSPQG
jgi:hypothetical protein